ncbi:MAG TPA: DUF4012 domain-containing protein [Acidimicrobiales bacterium]|nr:DUF4012 domain-containing protein [Acidimicrobiales bacterium]
MSQRRERSRRRRRYPQRGWLRSVILLLVGLVFLIAVVSAIAVLHAIRLQHKVNTLPALLDSVVANAEAGHLAVAQAQLVQAQSTLTSVNSSLYNSLDFQILNVLPVARENLTAVRSAVHLGLEMVGGGEEILQSASPLEQGGQLAVPLNQGQLPLSVVSSVQAAVADVAGTLSGTPPPPNGTFLLGRVQKDVDRVYAEAYRREAELRSVGAGLRVVEDIAGASGDRRYLLAIANSAEMRGSGGMILSYGVLTSHAGKVTLVHVGPIDEISLASPETTAPFPADFIKTYGGLAPTADWREENLMSDFTVDAPVMEAMYQHATGQHVDGVIQVDSAGLAAVLAGVGPVPTADLGTVDAANAVTVTLSTSYQLYPQRSVRQDYTGEVAQAAFQRLTSGQFSSLKPLGSALVEASKQRHVLVYTDDPTDETAIRFLGFEGALPPPRTDFTQLTVQNFGGNKLDYYLFSALRFEGRRPSQSGSRVSAIIDLANGAPPGQTVPQEVFGPFLPGDKPGEYYGLVTLYLPAGSYLKSAAVDGSVTSQPKMGSQNGVNTVTFTVSVVAGATSHIVLDLYIPPTPSPVRQFEFVPSPRVHPTDFVAKLS